MQVKGQASIRIERQSVDVEGMRYSVLRAGQMGPRVVCVHGIGVSSRYFAPTLRVLAVDCAVEAVDLPGFGRSGKPRRTLTVDDLSEALAAYLAVSGKADVLLANSFGCQVAVACAVRNPALVERLVLVGPTMDSLARRPLQQFARWIANAPAESPRQAPIIALDYLEAGLTRAVRTYSYALADPIERRLPKVRQPTLVVRGERDRIVPQAWAEEVTRLLPRGRLVVVPGVAHTVNFTAADRLAGAVRCFLAAQ
jgi:pimeloyl-ACP methyl ester carboxylesterase